MGENTSSITFSFTHDIDAETVSADRISFVSSTGEAISIKDITVGQKLITISFDPLTAEGNYRISFADTIKDVAGALEAGTVFDALDMPFTGCRNVTGIP